MKNRLRHLPGVSVLLWLRSWARGFRALARALITANRAIRGMTEQMKRLEKMQLDLPHGIDIPPPLHPNCRCETVTPVKWETAPITEEDLNQAWLKMGGGLDTVEPINLEGWMQLHAKAIGWNGRIVEPPQ